MKEIYSLFIVGLIIFFPVISISAVNLPWSTTFDCNDWKTSDGGSTGCDGLNKHGNWSCDNGDATIMEEQITSAANYPGGGGGKGQRHWIGDGVNNVSGGLSASFTSPQKEIWMRWYMRYESGFKWNVLNNQKIIYFDPLNYTRLIIHYYGMDKIRVYSYAAKAGYVSTNGTGWNSMMGGSASDGKWHLWEIHIKMDTNGKDGVVELWTDGKHMINERTANLGGASGAILSYVAIGENGFKPDNGRCMYVDYDDIVISSTGPISKSSSDKNTISPSE
ncbi:MAG: heparin lyase I family protein [Nitrospirota bacterium]